MATTTAFDPRELESKVKAMDRQSPVTFQEILK
jgi:hypothetical protein